jgi:hypothetical protein
MVPPSAFLEAIQLADQYDVPFFPNLVLAVLRRLASKNSANALAAYSVAHHLSDLEVSRDCVRMVTEKWNPLSLKTEIVKSMGVLPWMSLVRAYHGSNFIEGYCSCGVRSNWSALGWAKIAEKLVLE